MVATHSRNHQPVMLLKYLQITHLLRTMHKGVDLVRKHMVVVIIHSNEIHSGGMVAHTHVEMVLTITIMEAGAIMTEEIKTGIPLEVLMAETLTCIEGFQGSGILHLLLVQPPLSPLIRCGLMAVQCHSQVS